MASHSARVLRDAFGKNKVVSSVFGTFEELNDSSFSGMKNLLENYGYEELIIVKQRPFILYYEGDNDLDFLEAFGKKFGMTEFLDLLENRIYTYPLGGNDTKKVKKYFSILQGFIPELRAYALFDNLGKTVESEQDGLVIRQWRRREIESYLPLPSAIYNYVESKNMDFLGAIKKIIEDRTSPAALRNSNDDYWKTAKISDEYLTPIFEQFFDTVSYPRGTMDKSKYHQLVDYCDSDLIDGEVTEVLTEIQDCMRGL